jgi:hypothetical protein
MSAGEGRSRRTKVERIIDEYDLEGLGTTLVDRWTGESDERWSLRDLADDVNQRLLEAALRDAGEQPLEGEVENYYRLLREDDVSAGARTEARGALERTGIDVEALQSDFVSHQAVHTYLTDRQEVSFESASDEERLESARATVRRLQNRTETVSENTIGGLRDAGILDLDEFAVITDLGVVCDACGTRYDLDSLLEQGGCECQQED